MKKLLALVLALAMLFTVGLAFAGDDDGGDGGDDGSSTPVTPVNNVVFDSTVSITNMVEGDIVNLYKVIEWDGYWKPTTAFTAAAGSTTVGLTQADVDAIVGQNHETGATTTAAGLNDYINKIIAVTGASAVDGPTTVSASGTYSYTATEPGMYYALVTPKDGTRIYKPIFVSSDYNSANATNTLNITAAKYESVTLVKDSISQTDDQDSTATYTNSADSDNTAGVGDIIEFTLTTTIPSFPSSFTDPIFKVSDSLSHLELVASEGVKDIRVYTDSYSADAKTTNLVANETNANYVLTSSNSSSFEVAFTKNFITSHANAKIVVVYTARVLDEGTNIIDNHDNTAKVNFSNNPDDKVGASEVEDHTEHYSFTINGDVWTQHDSTDVVKVGLNADGTEITQTVLLPNSHYIGALQGAKFSLYTDNNGQKSNTIYKTFNKTIESGADGRFTISDLDAGTYWLVEEEAPEGYIKQQNPVKIQIVPVFATHTVAEQTKTVQYDPNDATKTVTVTVPSYTYAELASYKIYIDSVETASYSFLNDAITARGDDKIGETVSGGDENAANDNTGKVKNTKGVELPSTGGIGTTIFYILGGLLVIGAAVVLVTRRKVKE